jgi:hypothetical protein
MPHYTVSQETTTAARTTQKRVAVFIAHGMGQQIPFETLDGIADRLREWDQKQGNPARVHVASVVKSDKEWLSRIALQLKAATGAVETHVYEAYWAPMTEGRVTIRDVVRFLVGAGLNGLRNARSGQFRRWVLNKDETYPIPVRALLFLLTTLAVVLSLVVMNATIVTVAAGLSLLGHRPDWLSPNLLDDLTTTFNVVVTALILSATTLWVSSAMHARTKRSWRVAWSRFPTLPVFVVTLFVVILAGVAVPLLFYGHLHGGDASPRRFWYHVFSPRGVDDFDHNFAVVAFWLAVGVGAWFALKGLIDFVNGIRHDLAHRDGRRATIVVLVVLGLLLVLMGSLVWRFVQQFPAGTVMAAAGASVGWVLLALASAFVRSLLVQFVGDVAVYVMPYGVDAFADLRREIKDKCTAVATAIYGMKDAARQRAYDHVIVVGHSLGSVIAYDVLNQLIRDDSVRTAEERLEIVKRTPLFLTFGSPLDKTAFIFAAQAPRHTTEAREALTGTVQPMLQSYDGRPKSWINVHSGWDVISGHLDFYDAPKPDPDRKVDNRLDPDATSLLMAHTEYWKNDTVIRAIYDAIGRDVA